MSNRVFVAVPAVVMTTGRRPQNATGQELDNLALADTQTEKTIILRKEATTFSPGIADDQVVDSQAYNSIEYDLLPSDNIDNGQNCSSAAGRRKSGRVLCQRLRHRSCSSASVSSP